MKKIVLAVVVTGAALAALPMFAAFEAHVINVTAKIENALAVTTDRIDFGTVFPQEELEEDLHIELSQSFLDEDRVDDVEYIIRQKPKCGWTLNDGTLLLGLPTETGHVQPNGEIECPPSRHEGIIPQGAVYGQLPLLCPYISKHKNAEDPDENQNEVEIDAFHEPWTIGEGVEWNDARGRLAKSDQDLRDWWVIDLKVPCFGDHCAQDWEDFVRGINPDALPADQWVQPIENEHKIFGCDLWVEVTEVSEIGTEPGRVTVTKVVESIEGDPTIQVSDFNLFVGAEPVVSGVGESFPPSTYVISETDNGGLPDYSTIISCSDDDFDGTDTITVESGEVITCTVTNTEIDEPV